MVTCKVNFSDINNMDGEFQEQSLLRWKDNPTFNPFDNKENSNRKTNKSQEDSWIVKIQPIQEQQMHLLRSLHSPYLLLLRPLAYGYEGQS